MASPEPPVAFRVNGAAVAVALPAETPLLPVLRNDFGLKGARFGCGTGHCGACTVLLDGRAVQSCTVPLWSVAGRAVTTIEGLAEDDALPPAFLAEQAAQCGYCTAGIIMTARALLDHEPDASETRIRAELSERNLCRCGAHPRVIRAILRAARGTP